MQITEQAALKIQEHLERRGAGLGIRLGVKTTGCSGLAYVLEFVDEPSVNDWIYSINGIKVFVNSEHRAILESVLIDWVREGLNWGFQFTNPREQDRCGCGLSFRI